MKEEQPKVRFCTDPNCTLRKDAEKLVKEYLNRKESEA